MKWIAFLNALSRTPPFKKMEERRAERLGLGTAGDAGRCAAQSAGREAREEPAE